MVKEEFIEKVFPNYMNPDCVSERAILADKTRDVYKLNYIIQPSI